MKHRIAELEGALLDAAVAKAEGISGGRPYKPSCNWNDGGPIIERERITVGPFFFDRSLKDGDGPQFGAFVGELTEGDWMLDATGPTPLIAAMRAYVESKFVQEIELP